MHQLTRQYPCEVYITFDRFIAAFTPPILDIHFNNVKIVRKQFRFLVCMCFMIYHQINMFSTICIFFLQQPTWRYWGEEKVDGAIFTVYLKKVRYHTPTKSVSVVSNN